MRDNRAPSGVKYGETCPLPADYGCGGSSVLSSPSGVLDRAPAGNAFWHILKATERSFLHLHVHADALSSSNSVSCHIWGIEADVWGQLPPAVLGPKKFIACTEDLANVISRSQLSHHLYADNTQLLKRLRLTEIQPVLETLALQCCVQEIHGWCASRRLQLNPAKTELILFGSRTNCRKTKRMDLTLSACW